MKIRPISTEIGGKKKRRGTAAWVNYATAYCQVSEIKLPFETKLIKITIGGHFISGEKSVN